MKQTESFWEKLFKKIHKTHKREEYEKWREAFLRAQRETDQKLKELSARVKRNNEEKIMGTVYKIDPFLLAKTSPWQRLIIPIYSSLL